MLSASSPVSSSGVHVYHGTKKRNPSFLITGQTLWWNVYSCPLRLTVFLVVLSVCFCAILISGCPSDFAIVLASLLASAANDGQVTKTLSPAINIAWNRKVLLWSFSRSLVAVSLKPTEFPSLESDITVLTSDQTVRHR